MPKIIELRQDRSHIRSNFDGYKLSLDPVPLLRQELSIAPYKAEPTDAQYSLLHAELFAMQNLLQVDPWARNTAYFVNRLGEVQRAGYDENTGQPEPTQVVYHLVGCAKHLEIDSNHRVKGDYNYSMRFISEKYCILCDGINQLELLETGDRLKAAAWKLLSVTRISVGIVEKRNFMVYDCRLDTIKEQKQISAVLGRVHRPDDGDDNNSSHFLHLHWAKWMYDSASGLWNFNIVDTLEGKGSLYYCAFEPRAESLIISSNQEFTFRSQVKVNPVMVPNMQVKAAKLHDETTAEISGFIWTQTDDDVVIKFDLRPDKEKTDYSIKCTTQNLLVKCGEELLLDRELFARVEQDLTTWALENNCLHVTLIKETSSHYWPSLLPAGAGPTEHYSNGCLPMEQQPIANLEAPIEDCDFPMSAMDDEIKIVRFHLASKSVTHTVLLGSTPPLFATTLRAGFPAAIATRQDVDACIWLQQYNADKPDEWSLRHEGNLHAFGYIQASKQQRKFMDCSPDMNYALICESHRHLFLYKSNYDTANGLRNRAGPQVTIGKQHLITLEEDGEVLGIATSPNVIILLTENRILYLQIN